MRSTKHLLPTLRDPAIPSLYTHSRQISTRTHQEDLNKSAYGRKCGPSTHGIVFGHEGGWHTGTCYPADEPRKHHRQQEKPEPKAACSVTACVGYLQQVHAQSQDTGRWLPGLQGPSREAGGFRGEAKELRGVVFAQHPERTKWHGILHFKTTGFMLCEICLNQFLIFLMFIFERERERILSRLQALSCQHRARRGA